METMIAVAVVANLLVAIGLWIHVNSRLCVVESLIKYSISSVHHRGACMLREDEYSLWAFRDGQWQVIRPCTAPGFEVGPAPSRQGRFENEIVRTRGIRQKTEVAGTATMAG